MSAGLVLSCEHATWWVPPEVDLGLGRGLGLAAPVRSHHAWDEGALELAQALARGQGVPLAAAEVSRLVVDLNRSPEQALKGESFGLALPGNLDLPPAEVERRLARYHRPHREGVRAAAEAQAPCLHLSVHSFVEVLEGARRSVEVGILFDPARPQEAAASEALVAGLRALGWDARPNDPYLGIDDGLTTWLRPQLLDGRYAGIEVELNQGLAPARREALARDLNALVGEVRGAWPAA